MILVSVKKHTPPENNTGGKTGFQSTKSGGGGQFVLFDYIAKARVKGTFFTDTASVARDTQYVVSDDVIVCCAQSPY